MPRDLGGRFRSVDGAADQPNGAGGTAFDGTFAGGNADVGVADLEAISTSDTAYNVGHGDGGTGADGDSVPSIHAAVLVFYGSCDLDLRIADLDRSVGIDNRSTRVILLASNLYADLAVLQDDIQHAGSEGAGAGDQIAVGDGYFTIGIDGGSKGGLVAEIQFLQAGKADARIAGPDDVIGTVRRQAARTVALDIQIAGSIDGRNALAVHRVAALEFDDQILLGVDGRPGACNGRFVDVHAVQGQPCRCGSLRRGVGDLAVSQNVGHVFFGDRLAENPRMIGQKVLPYDDKRLALDPFAPGGCFEFELGLISGAVCPARKGVRGGGLSGQIVTEGFPLLFTGVINHQLNGRVIVVQLPAEGAWLGFLRCAVLGLGDKGKGDVFPERGHGGVFRDRDGVTDCHFFVADAPSVELLSGRRGKGALRQSVFFTDIADFGRHRACAAVCVKGNPATRNPCDGESSRSEFIVCRSLSQNSGADAVGAQSAPRDLRARRRIGQRTAAGSTRQRSELLPAGRTGQAISFLNLQHD